VTTEATGTWSGVLDADSQRLRLKLDFGADQTATISSLDQGNKPTATRVKTWTAEFRSIFARRPIDKDQIEGLWHQGVVTLPLVLPCARTPPPEPVIPFAHGVRRGGAW
jgi:hypothetical protein